MNPKEEAIVNLLLTSKSQWDIVEIITGKKVPNEKRSIELLFKKLDDIEEQIKLGTFNYKYLEKYIEK